MDCTYPIIKTFRGPDGALRIGGKDTIVCGDAMAARLRKSRLIGGAVTVEPAAAIVPPPAPVVESAVAPMPKEAAVKKKAAKK